MPVARLAVAPSIFGAGPVSFLEHLNAGPGKLGHNQVLNLPRLL